MRDVALRQQKDRYLEPIAAWAFAAIHPNIVSFVALLVGLAQQWPSCNIITGLVWFCGC